MPNWKKVIVSGSDASLNSLIVINGITGSLLGTASWANNATTASRALQANTASYVLNAASSSYALSASNAQTSSFGFNALSASIATQAVTASSADNFTVRNTLTVTTIVAQVITSSTDFVTGSTRFGTQLSNTHQFTGSVGITGSLVVSGSNTFTKGAGNFIELESTTSGSRPYIRLFDSNVSEIRINSALGATYGNVVLENGFAFTNSTTSNFASLVAGRIAAVSGALIATNAGGDAQVNIASPSGFSNYVSFRENGVADRGVIGYANGSDSLQIRVNGATTMINGTLSTVFASNGNVGIGTTSPAAYLDIRGVADGPLTASLQLRSGNTSVNFNSNQILFSYANTSLYRHAIKTRHNDALGAGNSIDFYTWLSGSGTTAIGGQHVMSLDGANVGIGTTTPTSRLHISSSTATSLFRVDTANGAGTLFVSASGNVGIGTTSPVAANRLQIGSNWTANPGGANTIWLSTSGFANTNLTPDVIITSNSATTTPGGTIGLALHNSNTTAGAFAPLLVFSKTETGSSAYNASIAAIGARTVTGTGAGDSWIDGDLMFYTAPTAGAGLVERMRIIQSGNIGIGMSTPTGSTLTVNGNIWATSLTGSLFGTASWANNAVSASFSTFAASSSYALTASHALNAGGGAGGPSSGAAFTHTQASPSSVWTVNHNLNNLYPAVTVYDFSGNVVIPQNVSSSNANQTIINFSYGATGYATAVGAGIVSFTTASLATSASYAATASVVLGAITSASYSATASVVLGSIASASYAQTSSYSRNFTVGSTFVFDQTLTDYGTIASSIVGSNNVFTQATGSYTSAFIRYTAASASNARSGELIAVWNGGVTQFTDISTVDIGTTSAVTASATIVTNDFQFNVQTNTSGWSIKSTATYI